MSHRVCPLILVSSVALALLHGGCAELVDLEPIATESRLQGKLTVTGSSTVAPLVMEMARRFEQLHPEVRIDVQTGGSGKGIADARQGMADIGLASRTLTAAERDLTAHPIAVDGVCLIVHGSNSITRLSDQQVVAIYTGRIDNWRHLGGPDRPITVVHKAEGRATLAVFLQHFALRNPEVQPDVVVGENEHAVKTVAGLEGAVGYVSIGTGEANRRAGVPIKLLPVGGVEASSLNVAAGVFPLSRPLNCITGDSPSRCAQAFIQFCQSERVHDLVVSQYFVPIGN